MVTNEQVRRLMNNLGKGKTLAVSAARAGMDEKTARKYRRSGKLPSSDRPVHTWRTRQDPFEEVWSEVEAHLTAHPGLEAKTLFEYLQRQAPGRFSDGQLRTLQRRIKVWRATAGPGREVMFPQVHEPGKLAESDFTHMTNLGVTIGGEAFPHLVYHFVLAYSNWETATICFSESFESLSEGLQNALWELGGVPREHRTDRLTTAVQKVSHPEEFTQRYRGLLSHYGLSGTKIQAGKANENGDVEQSHYRFKKAVAQELMLRGSSDFESREDYAGFLKGVQKRLNAGRQMRFAQEQRVLRRLPAQRLDATQRLQVRVGPSSTIRVRHNVYSVHSRLIREQVTVRLTVEHLEIWYGGRRLEVLPRLRGAGKHRIDYRHIIDWLVKKPGAFANYRYRDDLFPGSRFRMAYDALGGDSQASREYLKILQLAASESEVGVDDALRLLMHEGREPTAAAVQEILESGRKPAPATEVHITAVDLSRYDSLLGAV